MKLINMFLVYSTTMLLIQSTIYTTQSPVSIMNEKFEFFCVEKRILEPQFIIPHSCCWWYHHNSRNSQKSTILYISRVSHFLDDDAIVIIFRVLTTILLVAPEENLMRKGRFLVLLEWISEEFSPFCTGRIVLILVYG